MPKKIDITGQRYGRLVAIERSGPCGHWKCICDCGNTKILYCGHLRAGTTKSCGCMKLDFMTSATGNVYGHLTAVCFLFQRLGDSYWSCECVCGTMMRATIGNLKSGNTKSCGCKSKELQEKTNLAKYGTRSSFQNKDVRQRFEENNIKKYGVRYPAQNLDIALKTAKSQRDSVVIAHWKTGEELVCTASYEQKVVLYLNDHEIDFLWQPEIFKMTLGNGRETTYRPDMCIIKDNQELWVEIKGYFRGDAEEKWEIFHSSVRPNSELWDKKYLTLKGII